MGETKKLPQIKLLNDKPANESAFKSHSDIAQAVSALILEENEGKTVGLFGSWGSGKSTAVGLVEKRLKEQSESVKIFTFDAWLHGTDPLRRSFIEKLLDFYHQEKCINKNSKEYVALLDEITRRKEDQKVKTTPKIKPQGIIIGVLYIASLSFASFLMKGFEALNTPILSLEWLIWLVLVTWPSFFLLTKWKDFASIIFSESTKELEHTIIKTPDPTAIEFQKYFSKIITDAQKIEHKLVIVLDNIDRLSDDEAMKMLTTMRSFFCENDNKDIWVLVPFDTSALKRIFSKDNLVQNTDGLIRTESDDNGMVEAFVDKTFSVKFYVAPPLVTDNKEYFIKKFDEAFSGVISSGDIKEEDKEAIFALYENNGYPAQKDTPRRIKTFINDLGSLYRIWQGEIDVKTLALYCLKRANVEENGLKLFLTTGSGLSGRISHQQVYLMDNVDWERDFAAIYYGVEKDKALYVLAGDELRKGLEEGRHDEAFAKLTNLHGFTQILNQQILDHCKSYSSSGTTLMRVFVALGFLQSNADKNLSFAWKTLSDHTNEIERWDEISEETADGLKVFLQKAGKSDVKNAAHNILKALKKIPPNIIQNAASAKYWAMMLEDVSKKLKTSGVVSPLISFSIQSDEDKKEFWLQALLYAAHQNYETIRPFFSRTLASAEYSAYLTGLVSDTEDLSDLETIIGYLRTQKIDSDCKAVVDILSDILTNQEYANDTGAAARTLGMLGSSQFKNTYARQKAQKICTGGHIYGHLQYSADQKYDGYKKDIASFLGLILQHDLKPRTPSFGDNQDFTNGYNKRHEILQEIPDLDDGILEETLKCVFKNTSLSNILVGMPQIKEYRNFAAKLFQKACPSSNDLRLFGQI